MKNIVAPLITFFITQTSFAQQGLINGNFEDTLLVYDQQNMIIDTIAKNWSFSSFGAGITDDAYSGNSAVCIWNWYHYVQGALTNGTADFTFGGGTPISFKPTLLTGYYKYIEGDVNSSNDSGVASVLLFKYNSQTLVRDTIGYGVKKLGFVSTYQPFHVDIDYFNSNTPDSVVVQFLSSQGGFCSPGPDCLFLYIDDVALSTSTGISEEVKFSAPTIYPNPAEESVNITVPLQPERGVTPVRLFNSLGQNVLNQESESGKIFHLEISEFPAGVYYVQIGNQTDKRYKLIKK